VGGLGAAIVGDTLYGGPPADRLMLHASRLEFDDPATGERIVLDSPPPF
jgi:tRNA pseudouridine32 synthase / 23S rRNA pseudouridine746 synthase